MENSASPPKDPWYFPPIDRPREPPPPIDPAGHYLHWEGVDTEPWYATHTSQEAIQQMQAEQARQAEVHPGQTVPAERTEAEQTGAIQVYYPHPYQRQLRPTEMQEQQYMPQEYVYASTSQIPHTAYPPSQGQVPAMQHGLPSPTSSGEFPYSAHTPAMCTHAAQFTVPKLQNANWYAARALIGDFLTTRGYPSTQCIIQCTPAGDRSILSIHVLPSWDHDLDDDILAIVRSVAAQKTT